MIFINKEITVIDSISKLMRDNWVFQYIKENTNKNILYVARSIENIETFMRTTNNALPKLFFWPRNQRELGELIDGGSNIIITLQLFAYISDENEELLRNRKYTLISDGVLQVIQPCRTKRDDVTVMNDADCLNVDENDCVLWSEDKINYDTVYNYVKNLAAKNSLRMVNNKMLLWILRPGILQSFEEVYIATYLFAGSIMKGYCNLYGISYVKKNIKMSDGKYILVDYQQEDTTKYLDLINVYEGKLNRNIDAIPNSNHQKENCLSVSWFKSEENKEKIEQVRKNIYNYISNMLKARAKTIMWTTFIFAQPLIKGKGYAKYFPKEKLRKSEYAYGFLPCNNFRGTEKYSKCYNLVYCLNGYMYTPMLQLFLQNGVKFNEKLYALREMLLWIWNSRICHDEKVNIYIPSERMRTLLYQWMNMELEY